MHRKDSIVISPGRIGNIELKRGSGTSYEDFTWSPAANNTYGAFNNGQSFYIERPPAVVINEIDYDQPSIEDSSTEDGKGISRCLDGNDTDQNNTDFQYTGITPGSANECIIEACGDPYMPIYTIQGSGLASPLEGSLFATEGLVVGDFQDGKGGFFIQDATGDGNTATSDGIFVFGTSLDVNEGDRVRVRGTVDEFFDLTEISDVSQIWLCATDENVVPTKITLPVSSSDDFEAYGCTGFQPWTLQNPAHPRRRLYS